MVIQLFIKYKTRYGQALYAILNNDDGSLAEVAMNYYNEEYWHVLLNNDLLKDKDQLFYRYLLKDDGKANVYDECKERNLNLKKLKATNLDVYDEWQVEPLYQNVFQSKPFEKVFGKKKAGKKGKSKKFTHIFRVFVPHLLDDKAICISGSAKQIDEWAADETVLLHRVKDHWTIHLNLTKEKYPITYKFGIYDLKEKKLLHYEAGENRVIEEFHGKDTIELFQVFPLLDQFKWKGTGVNVPVSAMKSATSWGAGDFTDLNLLIDWAKATGIKVLQLLPINDTIATHSIKDSYPYASISAFALHPMYLNVRKLLIAASIEISEELAVQVTSLNDQPKINYEAVVKIKGEAVKELYYNQKDSFKDDLAFFKFFDLNRDWLVPYAAFCYLRDLNNSPDPSRWEDFNNYEEHSVQELVSPDTAHYDEIAIHYFTQYHLHLQLLDVVDYAHKNGIILKGDLPIGVGRYSAETWMHPTLFHMDMQAGAPPDAFAVKGQNWEFPTYNWDEMASDNYGWWRQRMEHMSNYFDAIRIDHILGFFRIWSIPLKDVEGILGVFFPSLPLSIHDIESTGIQFHEKRFCEPYITDEILARNFPGNEVWIKENILDNYIFKASLNSQVGMAAFLKKYPAKLILQQSLFDQVADVILLRDNAATAHYHFRINMQHTDSYKQLEYDQQQKLNALYNRYFFGMQDELWKDVGQHKLNALQLNTDMLICAEDLGMVPGFVENVLKEREILSLQVQRMPKKIGENFSHPKNAIYLSVVTPSTHDMSTIRQWWENDKENIQYFYNYLIGQQGMAPFYCEPWICKEIIKQHLESPAMWSIFLLQDILAMDNEIRREDPSSERINIPSDPDHSWDYRMHITLEDLIKHKPLSQELKQLIKQSGR
ncbi:MAG: 4-alpha-glucanotransferase [Ferruginibacter sp.]